MNPASRASAAMAKPEASLSAPLVLPSNFGLSVNVPARIRIPRVGAVPHRSGRDQPIAAQA
jgi:hypothetical protein